MGQSCYMYLYLLIRMKKNKYIKIDADIPDRIIDLLKSNGNYFNEKEYNEYTDEVFSDNELNSDNIKGINSIIIKLLGGSLDD